MNDYDEAMMRSRVADLNALAERHRAWREARVELGRERRRAHRWAWRSLVSLRPLRTLRTMRMDARRSLKGSRGLA